MDTYGNVNIQYAFTDLTVLEVPVFKNVLTNIETLMLFLSMCARVSEALSTAWHETALQEEISRDSLSLPVTDRVKTQEAWIFTSLLSH